MLRLLSLATAAILSAAPLFAADFDFANKSGINAVIIDMDSDVEPIRGLASGISGTMAFDPASPDSLRGTMTVTADSIVLTHPVMTQHMKGEMWLDVAKFPAITYTIKSVGAVEKLSDTRWKLSTVGDFTLKGVTREIQVPITVSYLADYAQYRVGDDAKGDILVLRADWSISRADYGVNAAFKNTQKVSDTIKLNISIAGVHLK